MTALDSKHVVADANVLGIKGRLQLSKLRFLADALRWQKRELWIPEPVALEWSEHAATEVLQASRELKESVRLIQDDVEWLTRAAKESLMDATLRSTSSTPNVVILPITKAGAKAGVRDQVMGVGAGTRKSGVKTGASDTASVHAVHRQDPDENRYIVLSSDSDWESVYSRYGWSAPESARDLSDLWTTKPSTSSHLALQTLTSMATEVADALSGISADRWLEERQFSELNSSQILVHHLEPMSFKDVESDPEERLIWGTLTFIAVVEGEVQIWDPMTEDWETWTTGYYDTSGSVPIVVALHDAPEIEVEELSVEFYDETDNPLSMPF